MNKEIKEAGNGWALIPKDAMQYVPSGWYEINGVMVAFSNPYFKTVTVDK